MQPVLADLAASIDPVRTVVEVPLNRIAADCDRITPDLLPLASLSQAAIDDIVSAVPGGAGNVQDIYPLTPLQEGILVHHLMTSEGDPYLLQSLVAFDSRALVDRFLAALQTVIDRHDVLRTAILWEGLPEPMQAVWRKAALPIEEITLTGDDPATALWRRFEHARIDIRQAPLIRVAIADDPAENRWLLTLLIHHLAGDHTTLSFVLAEVRALLSGEVNRLPPPIPFRNFVTEVRHGVDRAKQEVFFRAMLGDIDEPTAPLGLVDLRGDGSAIAEAGFGSILGWLSVCATPFGNTASLPPACSISLGRWFLRGSAAAMMLCSAPCCSAASSAALALTAPSACSSTRCRSASA